MELYLFSKNPDVNFAPVEELISLWRWGELNHNRTDVGPLDAPSFSLEVRDREGDVCVTASGTHTDGGGWTLAWSDGDDTTPREQRAVYLRLAIPEGPLDIDIRAPGHRPFHVHLTPEELTPSSGATMGWGLVLTKDV